MAGDWNSLFSILHLCELVFNVLSTMFFQNPLVLFFYVLSHRIKGTSSGFPTRFLLGISSADISVNMETYRLVLYLNPWTIYFSSSLLKNCSRSSRKIFRVVLSKLAIYCLDIRKRGTSWMRYFLRPKMESIDGKS